MALAENGFSMVGAALGRPVRILPSGSISAIRFQSKRPLCQVARACLPHARTSASVIAEVLTSACLTILA